MNISRYFLYLHCYFFILFLFYDLWWPIDTKLWACFAPKNLCISTILWSLSTDGFFWNCLCRSLICHFLCTQLLWLRLDMVSIKFVFFPCPRIMFISCYSFGILEHFWFYFPFFWKWYNTSLRFVFFFSVFYLISLCFVTLFSSVLQQTLLLFFRDLFKGICLAVILGPPIVSAIIIIVQVRSCINQYPVFIPFGCCWLTWLGITSSRI